MRHVKGPKLKFHRDMSTHYPCFHRYERRPSATRVQPASLRYPDSICASTRQSQNYSTKNHVSCKVQSKGHSQLLNLFSEPSHKAVVLFWRWQCKAMDSIPAMAMQGYGLYPGDGSARLWSLFLALF